MTARRIAKRMYAVSAKGVGIIEGTMAYSRRAAIKHFFGGDASELANWQAHKSMGFRTVVAEVRIVEKTR